MVKKISQKHIELIKSRKAELESAEEIVHDRIAYILNSVAEAFGGECDYWYFDGAEEGCVSDFLRSYNEKTIQVILEYSRCPSAMNIICKDGGEFWFQHGEFPTRWLFEDFEDELSNGFKLYKEKQIQDKLNKEQKKLKDKQKKEEMKLLAAEAKKKLSKDELKALLGR